jgi:hypothetical protein
MADATRQHGTRLFARTDAAQPRKRGQQTRNAAVVEAKSISTGKEFRRESRASLAVKRSQPPRRLLSHRSGGTMMVTQSRVARLDGHQLDTRAT